MKAAMIVLSALAVVFATVGLRLVFSSGPQERAARAHEALERIAFGKDGTDQLRQAVSDARMARGDVYIAQSVGKTVIWLSVGCSAITLGLAAFMKTTRLSNQVAQPTPNLGRG